MAKLAKRLEEDRAERDAARDLFDHRLALVRQDIDARGVGGRIADKLGEDARDVYEEALDIADNHRGVIVGTIAVLAIWLFRHPIMKLIEQVIAAMRKD